MRRQGILLVPSILLLLLVVPSLLAAPTGEGDGADEGAEASVCGKNLTGSILIASPDDDPPEFSTDAVQGINAYYFAGLITNDDYELEAEPGTSTSVILGRRFPDFNVAWYNGANARIRDDDNSGPESGIVPPAAAYAVVYMAWGPDFGNSDGELPGAKFAFRMGC